MVSDCDSQENTRRRSRRWVAQAAISTIASACWPITTPRITSSDSPAMNASARPPARGDSIDQ